MATALIQERGTVSGNQPRMQRLPEAAAQSFLAGTPVQLTGGYVQAMAAAATKLLGIAKDFGVNLTTSGAPLGLPANTANKMPPAAGGPTFGSGVQNQPLAKNFTRPVFNDGRTGVVLAIEDILFYGQLAPAASPPTVALIGTAAGLTMDTDNHWYVDPSNAVKLVTITGLDQWDTARGVLFTFNDGVQQLTA